MIITRTPLRISFAGGLTDFPDYYRFTKKQGAVVSSSIDKSIYVMVKGRFDEKIVAHYSRLERVDKLDEIKHDLIREALKLTNITEGIEISTTADIPSSGSGLGSSSSLTVGLLHALHTYKGELPGKEQLADEACNIEITLLENPIGKQDQYAAAYGGLNLITFSAVRTDKPSPAKSFCGVDDITVEPLKIDEIIRIKLNRNLMLFYTGLSKNSTEILSKRKPNKTERFRILDGIKGLVNQMLITLNKGWLEQFGELLDFGWELKKQIAPDVSNKIIDEIYDRAKGAGAEGGKIVGSGGGGFLLLYCPIEEQESVTKALNDLIELPFNLTNQGSSVIFNTGP